MKKSRILVLASSLIILSSSASYASTQEINENSTVGGIGSLSEQIFGNEVVSGGLDFFGIDLNSYLGSAQDFLMNQITGSIDLGGLEKYPGVSILNQKVLGGIRAKIGEIFGVIGYPNPNQVEREIPEIIVNDETEEIEEFSTFGKKKLAIATGKKQIMDAYIESRMGEEAQKQKKQQLEGIAQLANSSMNAATDAASQNVTQDVLKQIAIQQANNSFMSQAIHAELTQLGLAQNMSLSELSNISENMEQQEWEGRVNSAAARDPYWQTEASLRAPIQTNYRKKTL